MCTEGIVYSSGNFFSVQNNPALTERRIKGNQKAEVYKEIALRRGNLIFQFPFVRGVMMSGSLSKNYADDQTDIDFFIVTKPNRLWIARTLLVLFKRIFLLNSHKFFCVNYFVDEEHLEIEEKNLFTATELSTLVPLAGLSSYQRLMDTNKWVNQMLPHATPRNPLSAGSERASWFKTFIEITLSAFPLNALEKKCRRTTHQRWKRLYAHDFSTDDFDIAFKSKGYVSKNHPENFQQRVREKYKARLQQWSLPMKWSHD
jgi:hypothetical protein